MFSLIFVDWVGRGWGRLAFSILILHAFLPNSCPTKIGSCKHRFGEQHEIYSLVVVDRATINMLCLLDLSTLTVYVCMEFIHPSEALRHAVRVSR